MKKATLVELANVIIASAEAREKAWNNKEYGLFLRETIAQNTDNPAMIKIANDYLILSWNEALNWAEDTISGHGKN